MCHVCILANLHCVRCEEATFNIKRQLLSRFLSWRDLIFETMASSSQSADILRFLPSILSGPQVLVPLRVDLTSSGVRVVDTLCWDLYSTFTNPDEFAAQFVGDCALPESVIALISLQISEQIAAFREIVDCIKYAVARGAPMPWENNLLNINIAIRHQSLEYSDKFQWDVSSKSDVTPEDFAKVTCLDLGLPGEVEVAMAYKIREEIFRALIAWLEDPQRPLDTTTTAAAGVELPSDIKLKLLEPSSAVEIVRNLWKNAKPVTVDDAAGAFGTLLPPVFINGPTNANSWLPPVQGHY